MGDEQHTVHSPRGNPDGPPSGRSSGSSNGIPRGTPPGSPEEGEAKIGPVLERARLERGLTLEDVEQATKIRKRYLAGLERDDYGVLPDAVYAHGFLKTYANYLGLDGTSLAQHLKDRRRPRRERTLSYDPPRRSDFERPLISPGGLAGTEKRKVPVATILGVILAILALAVVIGALYYVGRGAQITGLEPGSPSPAGEAAPAAQAAPSPAASPGEEELSVVVSVAERPSWLSVLSDGSVAYERVVRPGFSRTFDAEDRLSVTAGDAGAVSVEVNGQDLGHLGASGAVLTRTWTVKAAS